MISDVTLSSYRKFSQFDIPTAVKFVTTW